MPARAEERKSGAGRVDIEPVLGFLRCRTPDAWIESALTDLDTLLLDHASLELKAAQQAQKLIRNYGLVRRPARDAREAAFRRRLVNRMSRLAREELRHFEQVVALIERRGKRLVAIEPARYAAGLHAIARRSEPGALVDSLVIGAVIEARSCERFFSLLAPLERADSEIADFYASLLRSEARHFGDYLALAEAADSGAWKSRVDLFLECDSRLVESDGPAIRFLSGPGPASGRG
jgi:tRNA-(ms[2]io[6]A)-hydroxylase